MKKVQALNIVPHVTCHSQKRIFFEICCNKIKTAFQVEALSSAACFRDSRGGKIFSAFYLSHLASSSINGLAKGINPASSNALHGLKSLATNILQLQLKT